MTWEASEQSLLADIAAGFAAGKVVPYLGPGLFSQGAPFPASPQELATWLSSRVTTPGRLRGNLTAVAQYIESFKHRQTLTSLLREAFTPEAAPTPVHQFLATLPRLPLVVDTWYDGATFKALSMENARRVLGDGAEPHPLVCQITGVSRAAQWTDWFRVTGCPAFAATEAAATILYKPHGSIYPESSFLVSDADYVEVLTEIDIQTPIPPPVQQRRTGRHFLFLGCRFTQQLDRLFARQIMKRSSDRHWAVLEEEPTRNEARFLTTCNIAPLRMKLSEAIAALATRLTERCETLTRNPHDYNS